MMKRVHALVILLSLFGMVVIGGCTATETATSEGEGDGASTPISGGEVDLTTVDLKAAVMAQMAEAEMYDCCLKMPCSQCLINMGGCPCAGNLKDGNAVCHECKGGWAAGDGDVEGVDADDVMAMPRGGGM